MKIFKLLTTIQEVTALLLEKGYKAEDIQEMLDDNFNAVGGCGDPVEDARIPLTCCIGTSKEGEDVFVEAGLNELDAVLEMDDWLVHGRNKED